MRYLGGKPLLCDGLHLVFYPVQAERSSGSSESVTLIELTIEKKSSRTAANIKRTPFEEENYIASAWSRPLNLPLSRGPRSIRVLNPQPQLVVTNVTESIIKGKALEGTINRILFKLQAGSQEQCSNFKIAVSCFSVLVTPSGTTKRLISEEALKTETENSYDMKNPSFRTPALVSPSNSETPSESGFGYGLPMGWTPAGSGQGHSYSHSSILKEGESSFIHLDLFRPATVTTSQTDFLSVDESIETDDLGDFCLCKTDYYVTITYQQQRTGSLKTSLKQKITRRPTRRRPQMSAVSKGNQEEIKDSSSDVKDDLIENEPQNSSDEVTIEVTGTVMWSPPLLATYRPGSKMVYPSGASHVSNEFETGKNAGNNNGEIIVNDGQCITNQCSLQLDPSMEGLETEIAAIRFEVRVMMVYI